ncbi:MAG: hypothetical protein M3022_04995 [Actinomycetota bacterium]|nr:hypothetical protein [Actinomycetota bacterium]
MSVFGALCVLGAYIAIQSQKVDAGNRVYLALNLVGSVALAAAAVVIFNLGVILLNVVWAIVSARALVIKRRRTGPVVRSEAGDR